MLPANYFQEKSEGKTQHLPLPFPKKLSKTEARIASKIHRAHNPPVRRNPIPWCTTGITYDRDYPKIPPFPNPRRLRPKTKAYKSTPVLSSSPKEYSQLLSSPLPATLDPPPLSSSSSTSPPKKPTALSDGMVRPPGICNDKGSARCHSWRNENGVFMTNITGFEDDENSFEPITMMSRNQSREIQKRHPRHKIKCHATYFVRVADVVDPLHFHMEFVTKPPQDGSATWEESLQRFYNEPGLAEKHKLRTFRPYPDQMYAVYNEEESKWERVRVHAVHLKSQTVLGMYLDRLEPLSDIPFDSLHELHPHFGNWPRYPIHGELTDIRPPNYVSQPGDDETTTDFEWPQEAIDYFKNYTKDKLFRAFVVEKCTLRTDNMVHASDEDRLAHISVFLFEVGAEYQIPVNAWLVQKGYAVPIKSMKGYHHLMLTLHGLDENGQSTDGGQKQVKNARKSLFAQINSLNLSVLT